MFKAVLFDLDNTIIDFVRFKSRCIDAAVDSMIKSGLGISKSRARKIFLEMFKEVHIEDREIFQKFLKRVIGKIDYKLVAIGVVAYRRARLGAFYSYPGIKSVIRKLKKSGIKVGIVTDAPKLKAWIRLVEIKLQDYFDIVVTYDDTGKLKPNPEPFLKALKKLNVNPEESIFVGDNVERDIVGANKLGMVSVLAKYGDSHLFLRKKNISFVGYKKPNFIINKPTDLISIVNSK